ncbi:MAG: tail fiber domain-containing protein, partial [Cyclobacteriaceae bacterium]
GNTSTAGGSFTTASGNGSIAMGFSTEALGINSTAMGQNTRASSRISTAIGRFNIGGGNPTGWVGADPVFEIGNGSSSNSRRNALTVLKNGDVGIDNRWPSARLHIIGGTDVGPSLGGYIVNGNPFGVNLAIDNNEIMVRNSGAPSPLYLQAEGGDLVVGGNIVNASDRQLKRNIQDLSYGLAEVLKLRPVNYEWKSRPDNKKYQGLIAQEVQKIIPEIVSQNEEDETLALGYTELIPVLIKAVQEQQAIIKAQNQKIAQLEKRHDDERKLQTQLDQLKTQLEKISGQTFKLTSNR